MLTAEQLARELNVSPSLIYRMAREDKIPHYRVGVKIRFRLDEVLAIFRAGEAR